MTDWSSDRLPNQSIDLKMTGYLTLLFLLLANLAAHRFTDSKTSKQGSYIGCDQSIGKKTLLTVSAMSPTGKGKPSTAWKTSKQTIKLERT